MKTFILFLVFFSHFVIAGPANCPDYNPPTTTTGTLKYYFGPWGSGTNCSNGDVSYENICRVAASAGGQTYISSTPTQCKLSAGTYSLYTCSSCPSGYTYQNGTCVLTNVSLVTCPPNSCTAGTSVGLAAEANSLVCYNGCVVKVRGMSAAELDTSGTQIGIKLAEWQQTGSQCLTGGSVPISVGMPDPNKSNCITNGPKQLCISTTKPGCGTVNGKEWCPDKVGCGTVNGQRVCVPDDGGCTPSGGLDFACTKNATPPPAPANEPPPVVDFKVNVPVQNGPAPSGGTPTNGAMPKTDGSDIGGTAPVIIGHYPGTSGNGTNGGNPGESGDTGIDTSGLAQESSLQSLGALVGQIKDTLTGSISGSGFTATSSGTHPNLNISPDIQAKQTELSTKLAQVKSEFSTLINFGSASASSALQCPTNSGFQFNGSTISLCTQSVLNATATIGNVLIFLAFVVSLYILLS